MSRRAIYLAACALVAVAIVWVGVSVSTADPDGRLHVVVDPGQQQVQVNVVIPIDEAPAGLPHYVEHLAWLNVLGSGERSPDQHSNAWANTGALGYWFSGPPRDLPEILQALAGLFDPLTVPEVFADQERNILLREYDMRVGSDPVRRANEAMDAFLYKGNLHAVSVIGTPDQITEFTYAEGRDLHARTHLPARARFVVVGDVSPRALRRAFRDLELPAAEHVAPLAFDLAAAGETEVRVADSTTEPRLAWRRVVRLPEPADFDLLEAEAAVLSTALDTTLPGGLAGPLRFEAAITRSFSLGIHVIDDQHAELWFHAVPDAGVTLTELKTRFEDALARSADAGLPGETFDRVLARVEQDRPDWDDPEDVAEWRAAYVRDRVAQRRTPLPTGDLRAIHDRITPERLDTLLRSLAGPGRTAVGFIGPEGALP